MAIRPLIRPQVHYEDEKHAVRIVGEGAMSAPHIGDGRFIPLIIVDTNDRPDLAELVRLHNHFEAGDVGTQWAQPVDDKGVVSLVLTFQRPVEAKAIVDFNITSQGVIVEQILSARALYIQPGKEGDKLSKTIDAPKILVEIPNTGFRVDWDKLYFKALVGRFRAKGLRRYQAKQVAIATIKEIRSMGQVRRPRE